MNASKVDTQQPNFILLAPCNSFYVSMKQVAYKNIYAQHEMRVG